MRYADVRDGVLGGVDFRFDPAFRNILGEPGGLVAQSLMALNRSLIFPALLGEVELFVSKAQT